MFKVAHKLATVGLNVMALGSIRVLEEGTTHIAVVVNVASLTCLGLPSAFPTTRYC